MSLDDIRARMAPLVQMPPEILTTIELQRIATYERYVKIDAELEEYAQLLSEDRLKWERQKAACNTEAKLRNLRRYPVETKEVLKKQQLRTDLGIELGEIPAEFTLRARPVLSPIVYPNGPKFQFSAFHTWLDLPPVPEGVMRRGKGPGESQINALMGGVPPVGGRFDHALPGEESAETKATDDNTFRGGATARRNINRVRRRIERIIDMMPELVRRSGMRLLPDDLRRIEWVVKLLNNVDASLEYGNFHIGDEQEFYSAIEILNRLDWNGTPTLHREDKILRHPEGISQFCRYIAETLKGGECFFTNYIFLVRPMEKPTQYLVIPQVDYDRTVKFLNMSKGDAHFRYYQPAPPSLVQDFTDVAA